ncbi:MAG TPA: HAD family phosphatase [Vicinamibacterales bacterium]|nr:HAD family phosphatase [Vicinamibacterales bacterium]
MTTPLKALQSIVFDFDGVIADSERLHLRSYQDILAPEGITISTEDYLAKYLGYDDVGVFKAIGRDHDVPMDDGRVAELIARKGERYESLAASGEMLFPGAADFIRSAVAAGVPIAIASGALTHEIEDVLTRAGILNLFPVIVGADQTERSKPHPDPYQTAFARLRAHTGKDLITWRSVAIEDSRWGLESARAADLRCVAVTNTYPAAELRADAELVVAGLHALTLEALDDLCGD